MNITLWVLQIILALYNISGAVYMMSHYEDLASVWAWNNLPHSFGLVIGIIQIILSIGLILPPKKVGLPKLTFISAAALALLSLVGVILYDTYQGFPNMLWGIIPAALLAFIAYQRKTK